MRTKTILTLYISLLYFNLCSAKIGDITFYRHNPVYIEFERDSLKKYDAYILEDNRRIVYSEEKRFVTRHKIVHIENSESINDFNKIYIYIPYGGEIENLQARSIKKDGSVIDLNKNNIKEITELEDNASYKIFAIEGAETGCQIEYSYTISMPTFDTGIEELSSNYPIKSATVVIQGTKYLKVHSKPYNMNETKSEVDYGYTYSSKNLLPIPKEEYASESSNSPFVIYGIKSSPAGDLIFSKYEYVATYLYYTFNNFDTKQKGKFYKYIKEFTTVQRTFDVIQKINSTIKKNFFFVDDYTEELEDIASIVKTGKANKKGMTKLFCIAFKILGINYQVWATCDKYQFQFDSEFCSRYYVTDYLIYLPAYERFVHATTANSQVGIVPSYLDGNMALVTNPDRKETFKEINSSTSKHDGTELAVYVKLNINEGHSIISLTETGKGYVAYSHNVDMYYSDSEDERNQVILDNLDWRYPDCEVLSYNWINKESWGNLDSCYDYDCKRSYFAELKSGTLYDRIGEKLILNVGSLIGPQNELYNQESRTQPIVNGYNKSYSFSITIEIPDGYKFVDQQNLNIHNEFKSSSGIAKCGFKSSYEIVGNLIVITIYEFYDQINLSKSEYDDFKRVINSAADFNKSAILFEKIN